MNVYPAIDIRQGRVVRLMYGDPAQETVYGDDPVVVARRWAAEGADWVHVVNLDGALGESETALDTLRALSADKGLMIQFGGGLRTLDDVARALDAGATRVVLGTMAVEQPALAGEAVRRFGATSVAIALDAKDGWVMTHGWRKRSFWTPLNLARRLKADGVRHILYTDVSRDGDLSGVNVAATAQLAHQSRLKVIASGGVASLEDVISLWEVGGIAGVVIGKALYEGKFALRDAIRVASGRI